MAQDQDHELSVDEDGFLLDHTRWTPSLALELAAREGIELTPAHWEIVDLLREFYVRFEASPANRALVKFVRQELGPEKGNSIYLMQLFPGSPARLGSKIAGLPKPENCL
ncbi:MAG: TusE/DsrC/DsvC family sulfur relay protein [Halieaceae bacterium]|jgi:tRNA 2-thiouridine synthesizing protein E|nr:TusE/DsrC/DsvC family sulfur relay protein [Halieaceae bacterium]